MEVNRNQSSYGQFSDINVWKKVLSLNELKDWMIKRDFPTKPFLQWEEMGIVNITNLIEDEMNETLLLEAQESQLFSFYKLPFSRSVQQCRKIGGEIATPYENVDIEIWKAKITSSRITYRVWLSYKVHGNFDFYNIYTNESARWLKWEPGQPNNWGGQEECCIYTVATGLMRDDFCGQDKADVICVVPPNTKFMMKGVCINSPVDSFYQMMTSEDFIGYTQTSLIWSRDNDRWEIVFTMNRTLLAFSTETQREFPVGTHPWFFVNNTCHENGTDWRLLLLHEAVEQPGNFCCRDGSCISSEKVCDHNPHCEDR